MAVSHWLVKSEPFVYSFDRLVEQGSTRWDGVRNHEARNHLRAMKEGDLLLFYHSNEGREVVGVARVSREAYPDPTAPGGDWSVVDVAPVEKLARPVTLDELRTAEVLKGMVMHRRNRLSVTPVTEAEYKALIAVSLQPAPPPPPPKPKAPRAKKAAAKKPASKKTAATTKKASTTKSKPAKKSAKKPAKRAAVKTSKTPSVKATKGKRAPAKAGSTTAKPAAKTKAKKPATTR